MKHALALLLACVLAMAIPAVGLGDDLDALLAEPATLKVWMMGRADQKDADVVLAHYNELLGQVVPNTAVDIYYPADMNTEFGLAMAAGEQIDLTWTGWTTNFTKEAKSGTLLPLDGLLEEYGQDILAVLGREQMEAERLFDGQLYQILAYQGLTGSITAMYPQPMVDLMRADWAKELNEAYDEMYWNLSVETQAHVLDLIEEYLQTAKENDMLYLGVNPVNFAAYEAGCAWGTFKSSGWQVARDGFTVLPCADEVQASYYERMASWYEKGYIIASTMSEASGYGSNPSGGVIPEDGLAIYHGSATETACQAKANLDGIGYTCFMTRRQFYAESGSATGESIPYTSKYPERAMMIINEMYKNQELYLTFVYGLEGTHYEYNADGSIKTLCGEGSPTSDWAYGQYTWSFGNMLLIPPMETNALRDDIVNLHSAYHRPFCFFSFDYEAVADQYANVNTVISDYELALRSGVYGADWKTYYDKLNGDLEAAGLSDVMTEAQKQITAFVEERGITSYNQDRAAYPLYDYIVVTPEA